MGKVIAIANQKGGVGKSFTTANLAVGLAKMDKSVLVIDNDPQGHVSRCLGIRSSKITIADVVKRIIAGENIENKVGIVTTAEGVDLLPADVKYATCEFLLINAFSREKVLHEFIKSLKDEYDYILIDCPPNLGIFVINALSAADSVLIPVKLEDLSIDGLQQLIQTVGIIQKHTNGKLCVEGILYTIVEANTVLARQSKEVIKTAYGEHFKIFESMIPKAVKAAECPAAGVSIFEYDPNGKVADAYMNLAEEVIGNE